MKDAIKRIQGGSKTKPSSNTVNNKEDNDEELDDEDDDDDSSDGDTRQAQYSSSLLQKFVESTEQLSGKRNSVSVRTSGSKHGASSGKFTLFYIAFFGQHSKLHLNNFSV